ncbi:MAG: hypothetical protein ACOX2F_02875 [bacterium]
MHFFVFLSYEVLKDEGYNHDFFNNELEEMGLYNKIKKEDEAFQYLPKFTYIGEYQFEDKEELKNLLYTEVKQLFKSNGVKANLFMGVCEKTTIGIEAF